MARTRNIKPSFFDNDILAECDPLARLAFAGLWCHADREGRMEYRPKRLKANILPYDDCDFDALIDELARRGFLQVYEVAGTCYLQVTNFAKHQNPHKAENPSTLPDPDSQDVENKQEPEKPEQAPNKYGASLEEAQNQPGLNPSTLTLNPQMGKRARERADIISSLQSVLPEEMIEPVVDHRKRIKHPLSPHSAKLLASALSKAPNAVEAANEMILRGWRSWEPEWSKLTHPQGTDPPSGESQAESMRRKLEQEDQSGLAN